MKKIKFKELSLEDFKKYGSFYSMINPDSTRFGDEKTGFYPDLIQHNLGNSRVASFSVCHITKSDKNIIRSSEFHNYCNETIMPLNGEVLMHVAPAIGEDVVPVGKIEVFRIPVFTIVTVKPGVWHHIPFTYNCNSADIMVVLPERTYVNDCYVCQIPEKEFIEVIQ
jgi:ureidoglycolate hydrolase